MEEMQALRALVKGEVFDTQVLMYCLRAYKKPRDKISLLLRNGSILQLKKGLYAFGPSFRKSGVSLEVVAAMLLQPSYISREYALSYYGLLPERVVVITSMTTRKKRLFETPLGCFEYNSLHEKKFGLGVEAREVPGQGGYLFATKEKALADWIATVPPIRSVENLLFFLFEESRIDRSSLLPVNQPLLKEISAVYRNRNVDLLLKL